MRSNFSITDVKSKVISGNTIFQVSTTFLVMATLIVITSRTVADADLWGHLRFGLDVLETGKLTQVDPYSYLSAGQRWINHEWLAEVLFALAWLAGNAVGLILLKTTVVVLTLGIIYIYLLRRQISSIRAGSLILLAWLLILPATTVRPHIYTILFSGIIFLLIAKAEVGNYQWLWAAPPIFALWVNFHGGFLAGLGFVGIWAFVHTIMHRQEWRRIIPPVLLSFLAILINPYGLDLIIFLLRTATVPRPEIIEWQPLRPVSILGVFYLIFLTIAIMGLVFSRREKRIPLLVLLGIAALLPFVAYRHLPLFALAVLVFGGEHIADAWSRVASKSRMPSKRPVWLPFVSIIGSIILLVWGYTSFLNIKIPINPVPFFPDRAVSLLKDSQVSGNLAVEFNWGEYAIWFLNPQIKVSMDGRRETVYSDTIYKIYNDFHYGTGEWDSLIEDYDSNMALVNAAQPTYNLMKMKPGWELVYEDSTSALFASREWSQFDKLEQFALDFIPPAFNEFFP